MAIPFDTVPNAVLISIHDFERGDRALVPVLNLAQHCLNIVGHWALAQASIDNRNDAGRNLVGKSARVLTCSESLVLKLILGCSFAVRRTSDLDVFGQILLRLLQMRDYPELLKHPQGIPCIPAFDDSVARETVNPNSCNLHLFAGGRDAH